MSLPATQPALTSREKFQRAREAAPLIGQLSTAEKNNILAAMAEALLRNQEQILAANRADLAAPGLTASFRDRLMLNPERIADIAAGVRDVIALPDPIRTVLKEWTRPNGLRIRKLRVPLGVIGVIYESRPNVTVDAAVLAFKAGNAVVLRGGKEAARSSQALVDVMCAVPGLPAGAIELLDASSRQSAEELMRAREFVDVLVPRGGPQLIASVVENATVPVIETGAGNCHVFVDESADLDMADRIVINAKTSRPSVCNAAEKLLVHEKIAATYLPRILKKLVDAGVEIRGDEHTMQLAGDLEVRPADEEDWYTEYSDLRMAVAVVADVDAAIAHINRYSTKHSDSIVTAKEDHARRFLDQVDSAAVYWNASTRFTDGGEFGFGAEMGISTQKLHCRGPFALEELTSVKYEIVGSGQIRTQRPLRPSSV